MGWELFSVALFVFLVLRSFERRFNARTRVLKKIGLMNAASGREIAARCGMKQIEVNRQLNLAQRAGLVDKHFYYGELRWALTPNGRRVVWHASSPWG